MLKALRRRFVLISMALVFSIMTTVLLAGIIFTRIQFTRNYKDAIARELEVDIKRLPRIYFLPVPGKPQQPPNITFSAIEREEGIWELMTPWIQIDEDMLQTLCQRAQSADLTDGFFRDLGIAYGREGSRIAFVNLQNEYAQLSSTQWTWAAVYVGALVLFYLLSMLLSNLALKPVKTAWQQQQRFISDASHELKTPLTVILANLDILGSEQGENQWLSAAKAEGLTMKKLIENLLFLAKSDEGREPLEHEELNLSNLVNEVALAFEAPAYEKNLTLFSNVLPNQKIQGNTDLLRQLLSILLDNAIKYTPEGGDIQVSLEKKSDQLILTVHNSKTYISPEHLEHLFDRFYRMDEARNKSEGGYGLGLSIAAEIARQHRAVLKASSHPQEGTDFVLTILGD
jgi:signal transduction histidine kinase